MPNVTILLTEKQGKEFLRDINARGSVLVHAEIENQIRAQLTPEPKYDRQTCLQGLYNPATNPGMPYRAIRSDGIDIKRDMAMCSKEAYEEDIKSGFVFFPSESLRSEFKTIAEGKWEPKCDDLFCACESDYSHGWDNKSELNKATKFFLKERCIYFPSLPQMESFIASRKKEEPKEVIREMIELRDRKPNLLNDILLRLNDKIEHVSARIGKMEGGRS